MNEESISTMQEKQIYQVKDVKTSNPRKLFRYLSDNLELLGYKTNFSSNSVEIKKDEVGDSGYVNANLSAIKNTQREEKGKGNLTLDFTGSSKVKRYSLLVGAVILILSIVIFAITGIENFIFGLVAGIVVLVFTLLFMLKRKAGIVPYTVMIWIVGTGEIYRARLSESRGVQENERGVEQEQIASELSIRIAAESEPLTELNELRSDIERLLVNLDSFGE